jgi:uncharacterized protein (DUF1697 family)
MSPYLVLLRAVNVGGTVLNMAKLRTLFEGRGFRGVQTYIQSGNLVFRAESEPDGAGLEAAVQREFGVATRVLLRSLPDMQEVVNANPFVGRPGVDESKLHVTFFDRAPDGPAGDVESGRDEFELRGREAYLYCPDGYGRTKLNNAFFERRLKVAATTRNWRTVKTLLTMLGS